MTRLVTKFQIGKVGFIFIVLFFCSLGIFTGNTLIYSLLLSTYGAKMVPVLNIVQGVLNIVLVLWAEYIFQRSKKSIYIDKYFAVLVLIIALLYGSMYYQIQFLIPVAFVLVTIALGVFTSQSGILLSKLFHLGELKKVYPRLSLAFSTGNIAAGVILGMLTAIYGNHQSLLLVFLLCLVSVMLLEKLYRSYRDQLSKKQSSLAESFQNIFVTHAFEMPEKKEHTSVAFIEQVNKVKLFFDQIRKHRIAAFILGMGILQLLAVALFKFWYDTIISTTFSGNQLTQFIAYVTSISSAGSIILRLFFLEKVMKTISFSRAFLLHSGIMVITMLALAAGSFGNIPLLYLAAAGGMIALNIAFVPVPGSLNFLYSFIPKHDRDLIRSFSDNIGNAASAIISAIIVTSIIHIVPPAFLIVASLIPASVYLFLSLKLSITSYALIKKTFQHTPLSPLEVLDMVAEKRGREVIEELISLYAKAPVEQQVKIIRALGEIRGPRAYRFLHDSFFKAPAALKKDIIGSLRYFRKNHSYLMMYMIYEKASSSLLKEAMYMLARNRREMKKIIAADFLDSKDFQIQKLAVMILKELGAREYAGKIQQLTRSEKPLLVQEEALKTLYKLVPPARKSIEERVEYYVKSKDTSERIVGLRLIGQLYLPRLQWYLLQAIDNDMKHVIKSTALRSLAETNPDIAVRYFAYYMSNVERESEFYAKLFTGLQNDIRKKIIREISNFPVEAIDRAIKNILPFRSRAMDEWKELYMAISRKFEMKRT